LHDEEIQRLDVPFTTGDRLPALPGRVHDIDLTGHTVRMNLARPGGVLQKDATITDAAGGAFTFSWDAGDLVTGTGQVALVRLINPAGLALTLGRFSLDVLGVPAP